MLFRYPIRYRVRSVKYPVCHMVPVFLDKRLFQMIRPNLLLSCASMGAERYEEALEVLKEVVYKKEK